MDDEQLGALLRALSDTTRRRLLDRLRDEPGLTLSQLKQGVSATRQALSKHLAVLEATQLLVTLWRGREKLHYLNPAPLAALPERWVTTTARARDAALATLAQAVAAAPAARGGDDLARALAGTPARKLAGQRIADTAALDQARAYLAQSAMLVRRLAQGLAPRCGYLKPADGRFSIAEHLWHLADIEELGWRTRFARVLAERCPVLPGVDGDRLASEKRYQQRPWRGAARRFVARRSETLRILSRYTADHLERPLRFDDRGRIDAGDMLAAMVAHDREHRVELAQLWLKERTAP